jgi:hypothetical protein
MPEGPPEGVCYRLNPLAEDGTGLQFGTFEEVLRYELKIKGQSGTCDILGT